MVGNLTMYPSNKLLWSYDLKRRSVLDLLENLHMWIQQILPTFLAISWMWQIQYKLLTHEKTWSFWTRCNLNLISSTEILIPITLVYHRWRLIHESSSNKKDLKYGYHVNEDIFQADEIAMSWLMLYIWGNIWGFFCKTIMNDFEWKGNNNRNRLNPMLRVDYLHIFTKY